MVKNIFLASVFAACSLFIGSALADQTFVQAKKMEAESYKQNPVAFYCEGPFTNRGKNMTPD